MPQFVQEDSYLRGERVSGVRADQKVARPNRAEKTAHVFLLQHNCGADEESTFSVEDNDGVTSRIFQRPGRVGLLQLL